MKLFGSLERLVSILFRKNGQDITVRPNQSTTYTAARDVQLPQGDAAHVLVSRNSADTLTNKSIDADTNTITNIENADIKAAAGIVESKLSLDYSTSSLNTAITDHISDATDAHDASAISVSSISGLSATDVQAALAEHQSDIEGKVNKSGDTMSGNLAMGGNKVTGLAAPSANGDALRYDQLGAANGIATLDGSGKVPVSQLPNAIMEYQGTWNASTNSPSLADGTGSAGDVYRVSVAGSQNLGSGSISFDVGDYAIYNGSTWEKADTTDAVSSVFGRTGAVTAQSGDYTAAQVTNVPAGGIAATTVQAAINELDSEKFNSADFSSSFNSAFGGKDTDDLAEGTTNLYFTNARAKSAAVADAINDGTIDVAPSQNAVFDALALKANKAIEINTAADSGLAGGGDLSSNRSLSIDPTNAPAATVAGGDLLLIADISAANALKKVTAQSIADLAAGSSAQSFTWDFATDPTSFAVSHTFSTKNVLVEIYDQNDETVWVNTVDRTSTSVVTLTRSEDPGANWTVVIRN